MAKIIGHIIGMQEAKEGQDNRGTTWRQRKYIIEDVSHANEGVIVTTFRDNIIDTIGSKTHGELTVEATYVPTLRYWDGRRKDGTQAEPRWSQDNDLRSLTILKGGTSVSHSEGAARLDSDVPQDTTPCPESGGPGLVQSLPANSDAAKQKLPF